MVWISLDMNCQNRIADHANTLLTLLSFWQGPPFLACYVFRGKAECESESVEWEGGKEKLEGKKSSIVRFHSTRAFPPA